MTSQDRYRVGSFNALTQIQNTWYGFGHILDRLHIVRRRSAITARNIVNAIFVFLGAIGITFVIYELWNFKSSTYDVFEFFSQRNPSFLLFSISLLFDLAVIARFGRLQTSRDVLPKVDRHALIPTNNFTWDDVAANGSSATDISKYCTDATLTVLEESYYLAKHLRHATILSSHVLASLLAVKDVRIVFSRLGISMDGLQTRLSHVFAATKQGETQSSPDIEHLVLAAFREAVSQGRQKIAPVHLLQVMGDEHSDAEDVLYDSGIDATMLRNTVTWILYSRETSREYQSWRTLALHKPKGGMNRSYTAVATPLLDTFSRDLTQAARVGALQPVIDRDDEYDQLFRIFETGKLGVLLVGFPGVGKRSIAEGLAARMASEEVPELLQDKRFVELAIPSLVGSSAGQGELEQRLVRIFNEIIRSGNIVLFIDNIHTLVGLSSQGAENLDVTDMISQTLERYSIPIVATTDPMSFRQQIEPSALMSVMQKVAVDEVDVQGAILILEGKSSSIEYKYRVFFTYSAISKAVELASRYLHEQYLPEKALVLLEEVASYVSSSKGKNSWVIGEDVATIISQRARVPVTQVTEEESEKLIHLEERMHQRIIGQEEAVHQVSSALRRARAELRDQRRPIANFLFLGPTGVGKTELAKTVADVYFGNENDMIRLDMSEYQDSTSIYRLLGSPQSNSGGYLTDAVRTKPFSLILLDELEKAHPDILNVFLQVMDDGRLTDAVGRTIDFTNTILIATSNAGSNYIQDSIRQQKTIEQIHAGLINEELRNYFRPEFLNRFDAVIVFKPLQMNEIIQIVHLMLNQVASRLESKGIKFEASDEAVRELASVGFDPVFGARPLRRTIQERVDNALADSLLAGRISRRDVAVLEKGGTISIRKARELS